MIVPDSKVRGGVGCCFVSESCLCQHLGSSLPTLPTSIFLHAPGELSSVQQQEARLLTHLYCQPSHQQVVETAWHVCLPHQHLPGEGFQGHICPQALSRVPAILLTHSLIHATCLVSIYYMPDTMLGTGALPQHGHPSPCPRQPAGKTDK